MEERREKDMREERRGVGAKGSQESRKKMGVRERERGKLICACVPLLISDGSLPSFQNSKKKKKERGEGEEGGGWGSQ